MESRGWGFEVRWMVRQQGRDRERPEKGDCTVLWKSVVMTMVGREGQLGQ